MNKLTAFVFCLATAFIIANDASAQGYGRYGYNLGGVNLNYYCSKTFGAGFKSVLIGATAGDWTCEQSVQNRRPISVTDACKLQYGKPNVLARALNWNDPLSWRCFQRPKPKG